MLQSSFPGLALWAMLVSFCHCAKPAKPTLADTILAGQDSLIIPLGDHQASTLTISPVDPTKLIIGLYDGPPALQVDLRSRGVQPANDAALVCCQRADPGFSYRDEADSLVWIGGNNVPLLQYDLRTGRQAEMSVQYVTYIFPRGNRVYFIAFDGLYWWDRATRKMTRDPAVNITGVRFSGFPDGGSMLLNDAYTYYFDSGKLVEGLYFGPFRFRGEPYAYRVAQSIVAFVQNDSFFIKSPITRSRTMAMQYPGCVPSCASIRRTFGISINM